METELAIGHGLLAIQMVCRSIVGGYAKLESHDGQLKLTLPIRPNFTFLKPELNVIIDVAATTVEVVKESPPLLVPPKPKLIVPGKPN